MAVNPNETLSIEIVSALQVHGLLPVGEQEELKKKLSTGKMQAKDWKDGLHSGIQPIEDETSETHN